MLDLGKGRMENELNLVSVLKKMREMKMFLKEKKNDDHELKERMRQGKFSVLNLAENEASSTDSFLSDSPRNDKEPQ